MTRLKWEHNEERNVCETQEGMYALQVEYPDALFNAWFRYSAWSIQYRHCGRFGAGFKPTLEEAQLAAESALGEYLLQRRKE